MGLPSYIFLSKCDVIRDWKTDRSKGYAFIAMTEPIYATLCIDKCNNQMMDGRAIVVKQGMKKETTVVLIESRRRRSVYGAEKRSDGIDDSCRMDDDQTNSFTNNNDGLLPVTRSFAHADDNAASTRNHDLLSPSTEMPHENLSSRLDEIALAGVPVLTNHTQQKSLGNREQRRKSGTIKQKKKVSNMGFG
jgi:RNA recognition motif-containing protein